MNNVSPSCAALCPPLRLLLSPCPSLTSQGGVSADSCVGPDAEGGRWHAQVRHTWGRAGYGHPRAVRGHDDLVRRAVQRVGIEPLCGRSEQGFARDGRW